MVAEHPAVAAAAVVALVSPDAGSLDAGGKRTVADAHQLVAYVVLSPIGAPAAEAEHVDQARALYEGFYNDAAADPTFDVTGWNSSYQRPADSARRDARMGHGGSVAHPCAGAATGARARLWHGAAALSHRAARRAGVP